MTTLIAAQLIRADRRPAVVHLDVFRLLLNIVQIVREGEKVAQAVAQKIVVTFVVVDIVTVLRRSHVIVHLHEEFES